MMMPLAFRLGSMDSECGCVPQSIFQDDHCRQLWFLNGLLDGLLSTSFKFKIFNIFYIADISYICIKILDMRRIKVVHVHLCGKRKDYYFGSIAAIFTVLSPEDVGAGKDYLQHAGLSGGGTVVTRKAIIKQSELISCSRNDG